MTKYKTKVRRLAEAALAVAKYSTEGSSTEAGRITQLATEPMEQFGFNEQNHNLGPNWIRTSDERHQGQPRAQRRHQHGRQALQRALHHSLGEPFFSSVIRCS
jgi:hypothetical protein